MNIEAQKDEPSGYDIVNRAVFYVSRLISSQKEKDFVKSNYNNIKRVFSIWICMNMEENSMDYIHMINEKLLGSYKWKGRIDLLNIVLIGIANELPEHDDKYELHRLLAALLSMDLSVEEKLNIIEKEYDIPVEESIREEVSVMCNLSQGIIEKGEARGEAIGEARGEARIIISMYKKGFTIEQIADITNKHEDDIKSIIEKFEPILT